MRKLDRNQLKRKQILIGKLRAQQGVLEGAINKFNDGMQKLFAEVESALSDYNDLVSDTTEFIDEIKSDIESYREERSENWLSSEKGQAHAESFFLPWDNLSPSDINIDMPDELNGLDEYLADDLESLPDEAES